MEKPRFLFIAYPCLWLCCASWLSPALPQVTVPSCPQQGWHMARCRVCLNLSRFTEDLFVWTLMNLSIYDHNNFKKVHFSQRMASIIDNTDMNSRCKWDRYDLNCPHFSQKIFDLPITSFSGNIFLKVEDSVDLTLLQTHFVCAILLSMLVHMLKSMRRKREGHSLLTCVSTFRWVNGWLGILMLS